jgi:hypothetical protein
VNARDKFRKFLKRDPGALDSVKKMMMHQMVSMLGSKVLDWVIAKPGRRFVFENNVASDHDDEGVAFYFEEDGEKATPDFMGDAQ